MWPPQLVVISGASRGIGLAFASNILRRTGGESTIIAASRTGISPELELLRDEYGAEKGLPTVTPDQVNIAKDQMKKDQEEEQPEPEKDEEDPKAEKPKQKMAASKYSEEIEELKSGA